MKTIVRLLLLLVLSAGLLYAGEIKQVRAYETWKGGIIGSTDPAGITYHPATGHLYISDSEINEIVAIWNCENIFEVNLTGDQVFNTFDAYGVGGKPCPPTVNFRKREPTGITFNEYDGFFYVSNDDEHSILRYDGTFGAPLDSIVIPGVDIEGITSDPSTGYLYGILGVERGVIVYSADFVFISQFSVASIATDPEGIAYNAQLNHLFVLSGKDKKIYEFTLDGNLVDDYDISAFLPQPMDAQGLTFAPSSDPYDNPNNFNLYIVDGQVDNDPLPGLDRDGVVYEAEIIPEAGMLAFDFLANKKFKLNDKHGDSYGTVHSNDKIELRKGYPSTHTGNLTAVKDIKIEEKNTVNGDVTAGGNLEIHSNAIINGTVTGNAAVAAVALPEVSFIAGGNEIRLAENEIRSLLPGSYGRVEAKKRSTLILTSGKYYLQKLTFDDEATLSADVSNGEIEINIIEEIKFAKGTRVDIIPSGAAGSRDLTLKQLKDHEILFDDNARFWGSLIAPLSKKVKLQKFVEFKGKIVAQEIEVNEGSTLNSHDSNVSFAKVSGTQPAGPAQTGARSSSSEPGLSIPSEISLSQNYPNPFNPETTIGFQLPQPGQVVLKVFNILGQEIRTLAEGQYDAGLHSVRWDGIDANGNPVSSGVYIYMLRAGAFAQVKKMTLLR